MRRDGGSVTVLRSRRGCRRLGRQPPTPGRQRRRWSSTGGTRGCPSTRSPGSGRGPGRAGPHAASAAATAVIDSARSPGRRTRPFLPRRVRPTSNCGLTSTHRLAGVGQEVAQVGATRVREMKDRSATSRSKGPPTAFASRPRTLVPDRSRTRGSLRTGSASWPCPTSRATTDRAPWCSRTWVKPPVEAPTSTQSRPSTVQPAGSEDVECTDELERRAADPLRSGRRDGDALLRGDGRRHLGRRCAADADPPGEDQLPRMTPRPGQATRDELGVEPAAHPPRSASRACRVRCTDSPATSCASRSSVSVPASSARAASTTMSPVCGTPPASPGACSSGSEAV